MCHSCREYPTISLCIIMFVCTARCNNTIFYIREHVTLIANCNSSKILWLDALLIAVTPLHGVHKHCSDAIKPRLSPQSYRLTERSLFSFNCIPLRLRCVCQSGAGAIRAHTYDITLPNLGRGKEDRSIDTTTAGRGRSAPYGVRGGCRL